MTKKWVAGEKAVSFIVQAPVLIDKNNCKLYGPRARHTHSDKHVLSNCFEKVNTDVCSDGLWLEIFAINKKKDAKTTEQWFMAQTERLFLAANE
jgi:hypothetical protein